MSLFCGLSDQAREFNFLSMRKELSFFEKCLAFEIMKAMAFNEFVILFRIPRVVRSVCDLDGVEGAQLGRLVKAMDLTSVEGRLECRADEDGTIIGINF